MKKLFLSLMLLLPMMVAAQNTENINEPVYLVVEIAPEFPGGQTELFRYLSENVHYPEAAANEGIEGRAICHFVVDKEGWIRDVEVVRTAGHPLLDKEAVRVIKAMPRWKPGSRKDGKPVNVRFTLPINFSAYYDHPKKKKNAADNEMKITPKMINELEKVAQAQEASVRKMAGFRDGETFFVMSEEESKAVRVSNGIIVSPNMGFVKVMYGENSEYMGAIHMSGDTMFVSFSDIKSRQLFKKEKYLYDSVQNSLSLNGEQMYYYKGAPYCGEVIVGGHLRRTIWYNAQGLKERIYTYKGGSNVTEIQLYPSGKTKIRSDHFGSPDAVQKVYDESGNEAVLTEPVFSSEAEQQLEQTINMWLMNNNRKQSEGYHMAVTTFPDGQKVHVLLMDKSSSLWIPMDCEITYTPAQIGGVPVSYVYYRDLQ